MEVDNSNLPQVSPPHVASPPTPSSAVGSADGFAASPGSLALETAPDHQLTGFRSGNSPSLPVLPRHGAAWSGVGVFEPKRDTDATLVAIQEACLLRYYVNELSHWVRSRLSCLSSLKPCSPLQFDICDPRSRFQLLVPERSRRYPPLRYAIFAVSARHLCRLPELKTPQGLLYQGQLLPNLTPDTAVEYMLKCIPVLKEFHETRDEETRELIVTTAVILRQFEEMDDDEDEEAATSDAVHSTPIYGRVNFLAILNAVLRSSNSADLVKRLDLLDASYWIALRQEVYYALRRGYSPQMMEPPVGWDEISAENKLVIHTCQVARWLYDDRSESEWRELHSVAPETTLTWCRTTEATRNPS